MHRHPATGDVFLAIADPTRRAILHRLASGERTAGELAAPFATSQSAISQHLAILRDAGLVHVRSEGRRRIYKLRPAPLRRVAQWVAHYERFWNERLDALGDFLDREEETQ
jgi:DNA-binding transcriptional ArsR family regulator